MAVTNLWAIKGKVTNVIRYITNPSKTTNDVEKVLNYIENSDKTEQLMYVTGINCEPEIAATQFMQTKKLWNKEGGRVCYHGYQSFREGEVDADTAHKIGVELAKRLWGDRFEVVVATHLNTGHYHNHFCLNSVSYLDGYKYHDTKADIKRMRYVSDELCREYGLSIESQSKGDQNKRRNYREYQDDKSGAVTLRSSIRADIDAAISASFTLNQFVSYMKDMGYKYVLYTEAGNELKYPKIQLPCSDRCVRLKSLGNGYSLDDYRLRVIRNSIGTMSDSSFRELESVKDQETIKRYQKRLECAGYRVIFTFYGMQLSSCKRRRKYREYSPELRAEIRKLDRVIALQKFCRKNLLDNPEKVEAFRQRRQTEIDRLSRERKDCRKEQKHWEQEGVSVYADIWKQAAEEKTKAIKPLYRDLRMCDEVLSKAPVAREQALVLVSKRTQEEHIRQTQKAQKKRITGNRK